MVKLRALKKPSGKELFARENNLLIQDNLGDMRKELQAAGHVSYSFAPYVKQKTIAKMWEDLPASEQHDYIERAHNWGMKVGDDEVTRSM